MIVPCRPGATGAGHQAQVGMQYRFVVLVGDRAEDLAFGRRWIAQQAERLITVTRQYHLVVAGFGPPARLDDHPVRVSLQPLDRCIEQQPVAKRADDGTHIFP